MSDHLIENKLGPAALGWALMLGSLLDGIPENTALGVSLGGGGGVVLLVAIAVGNVPEAFAGGATIAVLADSLMPEAYREGGWWVGLSTALGFLVAFALGG
ncbi:hypothetical protein FK531_03280 [Rhodococcus spelaei]|uniref:ZIP family metal transporter n=1 Tax=Rhodococcus spelaei TaxID=2546320 RepID=A0A541BRY0_9NOCA|nr:hypothetical protein FK531_03280 [Rhodococcus spelaei]